MLKKGSKPTLEGTKFKDLAILAVGLNELVDQCYMQLDAIKKYSEKQEPSTVDENVSN